MTINYYLTGLFVFLTLLTPRAYGHAMHVYPVDGGLGVQAAYDNGQSAAFSEATVFAPDVEASYVSGITDANGVFMFKPDRPGRWTIVVDDGMGHKAELVYDVDQEGLALAVEMRPHRSKLQGLITGLALIFGIAGWAMLIQSKRSAITR